MRGVPIGSPSRSGYALRLGARIRPTALRSFLSKPESETSLSSVVTSAGGNMKDPYCGYTSFVTSAGGNMKDPYCGYTSFVTSAGGQTNRSPQSEGVARTTGGTRRRPLIDPLWVGLGTAMKNFYRTAMVLFRPSVGITSSLRGDHFIPPWESFRPSVGIKKSPRRDLKIPTWISHVPARKRVPTHHPASRQSRSLRSLISNF